MNVHPNIPLIKPSPNTEDILREIGHRSAVHQRLVDYHTAEAQAAVRKKRQRWHTAMAQRYQERLIALDSLRGWIEGLYPQSSYTQELIERSLRYRSYKK